MAGYHAPDLPIERTVAGLSLVPWFCDASVQWALRLTLPGSTLKKSLLKKIKTSSITATDSGAVLVGVPGMASSRARIHFSRSLKRSLRSHSRGWCRNTPHGNHRYVGTVDGQARWVMTQTTPALTVAALQIALGCGRMVARNGPWKVQDTSEAYAVVMQWLASPEANVNPLAVQRFIALPDGEFTNSRFARGPFRWPEPGPRRGRLAAGTALGRGTAR